MDDAFLASLLDRIRSMPDIRQDKVDEIKAAIARGEYDDEQKLSLALDRLLEEL
jgi:anti-sigma28 factor (negative regulator of flagellin synthesis)